MIRTYFQMLLDEQMQGTVGKMKQFVAWFTHGIPGGGALRRAVYSAQQGPEILASVDRFFAELFAGRSGAEIAPMIEDLEPDLQPACGDSNRTRASAPILSVFPICGFRRDRR